MAAGYEWDAELGHVVLVPGTVRKRQSTGQISPNPDRYREKHGARKISDVEIDLARERFIDGEIDVYEFERLTEHWLKWDTLSPLEKRNYEMETARDETRRIY